MSANSLMFSWPLYPRLHILLSTKLILESFLNLAIMKVVHEKAPHYNAGFMPFMFIPGSLT